MHGPLPAAAAQRRQASSCRGANPLPAGTAGPAAAQAGAAAESPPLGCSCLASRGLARTSCAVGLRCGSGCMSSRSSFWKPAVKAGSSGSLPARRSWYTPPPACAQQGGQHACTQSGGQRAADPHPAAGPLRALCALLNITESASRAACHRSLVPSPLGCTWLGQLRRWHSSGSDWARTAGQGPGSGQLQQAGPQGEHVSLVWLAVLPLQHLQGQVPAQVCCVSAGPALRAGQVSGTAALQRTDTHGSAHQHLGRPRGQLR